MSDGLIPFIQWGPRREAAYFVLVLIGWLSLTLGCVPSKVQVQSAPQFNPSAISSIAILPFQTLQVPQWGYGQSRENVRDPEEIRMQFRLPGADQAQRPALQQDSYSVSEVAAKFITARVESILSARAALRVLGPDQVAASLPLDEPRSPTSLTSMAQEVGARLQVDGVLTGLVRTYREREGTRLGAQPAAVGFEISLLRPTDGAVLWKGEFFEEQKPLNQDIVGFFEKGGGFVTAKELSELGVEKVMKTFPVGQVAEGSR